MDAFPTGRELISSSAHWKYASHEMLSSVSRPSSMMFLKIRYNHIHFATEPGKEMEAENDFPRAFRRQLSSEATRRGAVWSQSPATSKAASVHGQFLAPETPFQGLWAGSDQSSALPARKC